MKTINKKEGWHSARCCVFPGPGWPVLHTESSSLAKNMILWTDTLILIKYGIASNMLLNRFRLWKTWKFSLCNILPFNKFFLNWHLVRKKLNSAHEKVRAFVVTLEEESHYCLVLTSGNHSVLTLPQLHNTVTHTHTKWRRKKAVVSSPRAIHSLAYSDSTFWGKIHGDRMQTHEPGEKFSTKIRTNHHSPAKTPRGGFGGTLWQTHSLQKKSCRRKTQKFLQKEKVP